MVLTLLILESMNAVFMMNVLFVHHEYHVEIVIVKR